MNRLHLFAVSLTITFTLSACVNPHTRVFGSDQVSLSDQHLPNSIALIRFDYIASFPPEKIDLEDDNDFEQGVLPIFESVGYFAEDSDTTTKILNAVEVYTSILGAYERTLQLMEYRNNLKSMNEIQRQKVSTALAIDKEVEGATITPEKIVAVLQNEYDTVYKFANEHLTTTLGLPLLTLDTAKDTVPFDDMGYPLGEITQYSIPQHVDAGLAIAVIVDYNKLKTKTYDDRAEKTWELEIKIHLEMIDRENNVLWNQKIEHISPLRNIRHYHQDSDTEDFIQIRRAGPNLYQEIEKAFGNIQLSTFS